MSRGDQTLGTRQLDILSFSSNAEVASFGNLGSGVMLRIYENNTLSNAYMFGVSNNSMFTSNVASPTTTFSLGNGSITGVSNISAPTGSTAISFSGASLAAVSNITLLGSVYDGNTGTLLKLGGGVNEYERIETNTAELGYSNASVIYPPDTTVKEFTLPAPSGYSVPTFTQKYIYASGSNYSFTVTASNADSTYTSRTFAQGTDMSEIEYVWTSNAWTYVGQRTGGSSSADFTNYSLSTQTDIRTNDTNDTNRAMFTFSLNGGGRFLVIGNMSYSNLSSTVALDETNWATLGLYSGSSPPSLSATPLQSVPVTTVTGQNISFTFAIDTMGLQTTYYTIALSGAGQTLRFPAGTTVRVAPLLTARGLGTNDSISVKSAVQMNPVRQVFTPSAAASSFSLTMTGNFTASASNVDVYINGQKYIYVSNVSKDYDVVANYDSVTNISTFLVSLISATAYAGDIVEITVWPSVTLDTYYQSGYFYQTNLATSTPWLNVAGGGVRYGGRVIVDGDIIVRGNIFGGSNTTGFQTGVTLDPTLQNMSCNVVGTSNIIDGAVTVSKMYFDNSLIPVDDGSYDLGSNNSRWRNITASGTISCSNLSVLGSTTTINVFEASTSNVQIVNTSGTGPALSVKQSGYGASYPVADFYDIDVSTTIPAFRIADGGNVGVGTTNPLQLFHANGSARVTSFGVGTNASGTAGEIRATGDITAFYSDARLKTNVHDIEDALGKVQAIRGVYYTQNELAEQFGYSNYAVQVGVIAQDVQAVLPEVVTPAPFDIDANGDSLTGESYLTVKYEKLVPLLVNAIKELEARVAKLES